MSLRPRSPRLWRHRLALFLSLGALGVLLAGGGFAALESKTVSNYWEGLWWALSLMTTVGFVGESPETTGGRVLSAVLMVAGFALITLTTAAIASLFVREEEAPGELEERAFEQRVLVRLDELGDRLVAIERALPVERSAADVRSSPPVGDGSVSDSGAAPRRP
jgi:voltage-gated potassium channel